MIVRKIKDSEYKRACELFNLAFELSYEDTRSNEELIESAKHNPKSRFDLYYQEKWAAFDKHENMMACTGTIPFKVRFDGNEVLMSGISGVSTLPHHRNNGVMKNIVNSFLMDLYQNNYTFSYLYPFSTHFYNKFGYALCSEVIRWNINIKSIKKFDINYTAYLHEKGSHTNDFKIVYDEFIKHYNMSVVRETIDHTFLEMNNPAKDKHYIYIVKDQYNHPFGTISFKKVNQNNKTTMMCDHLYFSNLEGLKAILNLVTSFSSYYEYLQFILPSNIRIADLIPEWVLQYSSRQLEYRGMVRVINVLEVFKRAKYQGNGQLIIKINDSIIANNNHTYKIIFKNDRLSIISYSNEIADLELGIDDFSRLIVGTHDYDEFIYLPHIKINSNQNDIKKVFYKKKNMIYDLF